MSTHQTAVTQYIDANGTKLAYRRLGQADGIPLVMMSHFRANMDWWDPALIDNLGAARPVIIFDNAGIGKSSGVIPNTYAGWAAHVIALIQALKLPQVDALGFSMGGCVAQMLALNAPKGLIRRVIFAGTVPSEGPDSVNVTDWHPFELLKTGDSPDEIFRGWAYSFFPDTDKGRFDAATVWARIHLRQEDRAPYLSAAVAEQQTAAFVDDWAIENTTNSYHRLGELKIPVFIANGDDDRLCPTPNSWVMLQKIEGARLAIYPRAGHGFLYQFAQLFAGHVNQFLNAEDERTEYPSTPSLG
jgi:pimeloyl-ACP methyl ester carboxylesterase